MERTGLSVATVNSILTELTEIVIGGNMLTEDDFSMIIDILNKNHFYPKLSTLVEMEAKVLEGMIATAMTLKERKGE